MNDDSISLNKYLSSKGYCSRREADKLIDQGRVMLNGTIARKGNRVSAGDEVQLDGKTVKANKKPKPIYLKFNKPEGVTCTTDSRDPSNIIDYINFKQRIFPIGRLDKNSSGLILLTNDGDIVNKILRREHNHEKEYIVTVNKAVDNEFLNKMSRPIPMLGTQTQPCKVFQLKHNVFKIILTQGLNRQIRRMVEYCGYRVVALKRVRIMHIQLGHQAKGEWQYLNDTELDKLLYKVTPQ